MLEAVSSVESLELPSDYLMPSSDRDHHHHNHHSLSDFPHCSFAFPLTIIHHNHLLLSIDSIKSQKSWHPLCHHQWIVVVVVSQFFLWVSFWMLSFSLLGFVWKRRKTRVRYFQAAHHTTSTNRKRKQRAKHTNLLSSFCSVTFCFHIPHPPKTNKQTNNDHGPLC